MSHSIKQILAHFICFIQDSKKARIAREVMILADNKLHYRCKDGDGIERHYTCSISEFEVAFSLDFNTLLKENNIKLPN